MIPFLQVIQALLDVTKPFPLRYLRRFSDLEDGDLKSLLAAWPDIPLQRKFALLEDLDDLADSDTLMSFETLGRTLLSDAEAGIRIRAIALLWECLDSRLIPVYLDILTKDMDNEVRAAAAAILRLFIYQGELEELPKESLRDIEEALLNAVSNGATTLIRRRALEALGVSSRDEVPGLIKSAYHRKEPDWIVSAIFAMGYSDDDRWEKYILAHLHDQITEVRSEAIRAAGRLGLASARIPLLDLLEDEEDLEARRDLVWALSEIGGEGMREKLEELLDIESDEDEIDFLEEAMENLLFTEDLNQFDLLEYDNNRRDEENNT